MIVETQWIKVCIFLFVVEMVGRPLCCYVTQVPIHRSAQMTSPPRTAWAQLTLYTFHLTYAHISTKNRNKGQKHAMKC